MGFDNSLYKKLFNLRNKIKENEKGSQCKTPLVCSDDALREIVTMSPSKLKDFESIPGVGRTFIDNYAKDFLKVIVEHKKDNKVKSFNITDDVENTLKELSKKLVNINKKNHLLYMPKIHVKSSYDLFDDNAENIENLLFCGNSSLLLCDTDKTEEDILKYKQLVNILRETSKTLREKGHNTLYVGYPFVVGKMKGENFNVRAPLALFPVDFEKTSSTIKITLDNSRDVIYNSNIILANYKFNNINKPLPLTSVESPTEPGFLNNLIDFYKENSLNISIKNQPMTCFKEYKESSFDSFKSGEMYIEPCAVLGKFETYSSSLQKDFDKIINEKQVNDLLNELLTKTDDMEYDDYHKYNTNNQLSEKEIVYINDLNSSQEKVLDAISHTNKLVVQGPPGTGKSQTITSLISEFAFREKSILMVSEKKTALNVVYSRLGDLSKYALIIDDVNNKDLFYSQLNNIMSIGTDFYKDNLSVETTDSDIEERISRLQRIAEKLYETNDEIGIEPYKLYLDCKKEHFDEEQIPLEIKIRQAVNPRVFDIKYSDLKHNFKLFSDNKLSEKIEMFINISHEYPWLKFLKPGLNEIDYYIFKDKAEKLSEEILSWNFKNVFARQISRSLVITKINRLLNDYFTICDKSLVESFLYDPKYMCEGIYLYSDYFSSKSIYSILKSDEIEYFKSILKIKDVAEMNIDESNKKLYNEILHKHISDFETENIELFFDISSFDKIIHDLAEMIDEKKEITHNHICAVLNKNLKVIYNSKHYKDFIRAIESKRKWSVNKFINKFEFELFKGIKIWLMTPEVVSEIVPCEKGFFDLVVFDEASQMYIEKGIPAILRAKKVVIAGDSKQLRPSSLGSGRTEFYIDETEEYDEVNAAVEEESLLDLAKYKYNDILLNFHYRSKYEELIAFSNAAFYGGKLYISPNTETPSVPPIEVHRMENATWVNRSNLEEAKYVVSLLKDFFENRTGKETIGVITFNSSQRDLIYDLIEDECRKDTEFENNIHKETNRKYKGEDIGLFIKNIESVQGDERDEIIFSVGYAKNEDGRLIRQFGWLNQDSGENRLNVAITRARKKIHIVTSFSPAELHVNDTKNDGPRILKKYLEYAECVSNNDKEGAKLILSSFANHSDNSSLSFDSKFEIEVYNALIEKGFDVDTQVGVGGYRIDLAIKKNNNYILGIECDGKLYHNSKSARERDYHRQKYLESRGWKIHRIWSTNWWNNPDEEIEKIVSLTESL